MAKSKGWTQRARLTRVERMWAARVAMRRSATMWPKALPRSSAGHNEPHTLATIGERHASTAASAREPSIGCPFSILHIEPTNDFSEIKRAYFEAAARCHPDVMSASALSAADPHVAAQEFHLVTAAYQALQDPWTRTSLAIKQPQAGQQTRPMTDRATATSHDPKWRREQQEMEWCVCSAIHASGSLSLTRNLRLILETLNIAGKSGA